MEKGDEVVIINGGNHVLPSTSQIKASGSNGLIKTQSARKTMSSFTPSQQFRKRPTLITLDSDDETEGKPPDSKKRQLSGVEAALATIIDSCGKCRVINKVEESKIDAKLKKRGNKLHKDFREDGKLVGFLLQKSSLIDSDPESAFKYLREIFDELTKYSSKSPKPAKSPDGQQNLKKEPEPEVDEKTQRHIKKLEKALRSCGRHIRKLEAREIDLSDLDKEDSNYVLESKFKKRFMAIYKKISQLRGLSSSLNRKADHKFRTETSSSSLVNKEIESFVNKRSKGQSQDMVPDYTDILGFYQKAKHVEKDLSEDAVKSESRATFEIVVKNLKGRRLCDLQDNLDGYLESEHLGTVNEEVHGDPELNSVLERHAVEAEAKISKVVDDFVKKQEEIKEEPKDEEEESDTEDDDVDDDLTNLDDPIDNDDEEEEKEHQEKEENSNRIIEEKEDSLSSSENSMEPNELL